MSTAAKSLIFSLTRMTDFVVKYMDYAYNNRFVQIHLLIFPSKGGCIIISILLKYNTQEISVRGDLMTTPKISVVIPAYNAEKFIIQALTYVYAQTVQPYEVLVTNNGSTDGTLALLEQYQQEHPQLNLIVTSQDNKGISGSKNTGISLANGEYICFLDVDDVWYPQKLEVLLQYIAKYPQVDVFYHAMAIRWPNRVENPHYYQIRKDYFRDLLFRGNRISGSGTAIRTTAIRLVNGFDKAYKDGQEDYDCWMRMAKNGAIFQLIPERLGEITKHMSNISGDTKKHMTAVWFMMQSHYDVLLVEEPENSRSIQRHRNQSQGLIEYTIGRESVRNADWVQAKLYLLSSIKHNPFYLKVYIMLLLTLTKIKR